MVFAADYLEEWLVAQLTNAGRKKLATLVLGNEQERALPHAATTVVILTAEELRSESGERTAELAMVVSEGLSWIRGRRRRP
jgi:hypothetical protein